MQRLSEILRAQTSDEVVLVRDMRGYVAEAEKHGNVPLPVEVIVQVVLERTAVVYRPGRVDDKRVIRHDRILVREEDVKWVPRNPRELQAMRARAIGQERGRLVQGK